MLDSRIITLTIVKHMRKFLTLILVLISAYAAAQSSVSSAGGNATGTGGSVSYSVGQVGFSFYSSGSGSVTEGVQQTYSMQPPDTVRVTLPVVNGQCSTTVDVPVRVYDFRNLASMQGSVGWPTEFFSFQSISGFGPATIGLTEANFGLTQTTSGSLSFSWNDPTLKGVSLNDSTILFTIRLQVLKSGNTEGPSLLNTPLPFEFIDNMLNTRVVTLVQGRSVLTCDAILAGKVTTPLAQGVKDVEMRLSGTSTAVALTDNTGAYRLQVSPGNYVLIPFKNNDKNKLNGVTTMDISLIQSHLLMQSPLNSPFKIIAADANNSGTVSTLDILHIRRLILGIDTTLPGNRLWAFVTGVHQFSNAMNPFPYPSTKTLNNAVGELSTDFTGVKIGDVNYDRNPQVEGLTQARPALLDTVRLYYRARSENGGYVVEVRSRGVENLMGMQYTLSWDAGKLRYEGIGSNPLGIETGDRWASEGELGMSWNDPRVRGVKMTDGDLLFELRFSGDAGSEMPRLRVSSSRVPEEAFDNRYQELAIRLDGVEDRVLNRLVLYPNPAVDVLNLRYGSDKGGSGEVRLLDMTGKVVYRQSVKVNRGENRYRVDLSSRKLAKGTYVLQVAQGDDVRSVKAVIGNE